MKTSNYFPENQYQENIEENVRERWNFVNGFPLARNWVICPLCGTENVQYRRFRFHERNTNTKNPYRCDVLFKCRDCSMAWGHGVVVPREEWVNRDKNSFEYREAKRLVNDN